MRIVFYQLVQLAFLLIMINPLTAQSTTMHIPGVYFMRGVMETASVFDLKPDSSFEFFFSQGALDRGGKGRWTVRDGKIILNSTAKRPPKDYALVSSKKMPGNFTLVKMVDKNTMILSYSDVAITTPGGTLQHSTNSSGEAQFAKQHATQIALLFRLCPDRESVFTVNKDHNYFEFRLEPWIAEVFFDNFQLQWADKELSGQHPLLEGNSFTYQKE